MSSLYPMPACCVFLPTQRHLLPKKKKKSVPHQLSKFNHQDGFHLLQLPHLEAPDRSNDLCLSQREGPPSSPF